MQRIIFVLQEVDKEARFITVTAKDAITILADNRKTQTVNLCKCSANELIEFLLDIEQEAIIRHVKSSLDK